MKEKRPWRNTFTYGNEAGHELVRMLPPDKRDIFVPKEIAMKAYEMYGNYQSFERLHERGGFSSGEIIALLMDKIEFLEEKLAKFERVGGE
jgi:hypothetical protein